jgi:hypothetical protein
MTAELLPAIYRDEDSGAPISTQSMIKTFRRCPKQAQYKYVERLKPRALGKPLREGDWGHKLLETYYKGGEWRDTHELMTRKFATLMDEEREMVGDMPRTMERLMLSYLWHYRDDPWTIHDTEFMLEAELPNGHIFRVKIDLLVEDQFGLWLVDHKFNAKMPDSNFRILDIQSPMYVWAALKNKIPVNGFIWNYVRRKPPTIPQITKAGRLSYRKIETDYLTLARSIKTNNIRPALHKDWLLRLKAQRYQHGEPQISPFFQRRIIERNNDMLKHFAREALHTSKRMHSYPFDNVEIVERVPDRSCGFMCSYSDICTLEAFGGDTRNLRKQRYEVVDPMYYYNDDPKEELVRGEE